MKSDKNIYDVAGIGIGPFNLGLAALTEPIKNLSTIFLEQKSEFNWHDGMLIPGSTLQVSYLADLVTLADPSSKFSYLNFLRSHNRLIQFGVHEQGYITRSEYNRYCRWVCGQLNNLIFGYKVNHIHYDPKQDVFIISSYDQNADMIRTIKAHKLVVGIGSQPGLPCNSHEFLGDKVLHAADYMYRRPEILKSKKVVLIGSGQSAAEIFYDLLYQLDTIETPLHWYTRSDRFYAMEHSKLNYEMTSPDYIDFFFGLERDEKTRLLKSQATLYKGINHQLINAIYDRLYSLFTEGHDQHIRIQAHAELRSVSRGEGDLYNLEFYHNAMHQKFTTDAASIILATGYTSRVPDFLDSLENIIKRDADGAPQIKRNYSLDDANRIFIQNAELHTHGFNAPDLGLGAYRNAVIINTILGEDHYPVDFGTSFQSFGCAV
ncbi:lysine N(6)-hydroxylase/L-ornithine N(5)-oxygenase family protein [Niabella sp. 22666]|uniref:lysine N(6)-hydroxylase/L-ornithine N(5)-oxygenase family protein n=1 Tax=Niabella sp. 22666 TaxID=3453954 RepID=UPI003F83BF60